MYKTILVPLDGSKRVEAILPHVKNLSLCFNAKVIFFIVVEPSLMLEYDEVIDMSSTWKNAIIRGRRRYRILPVANTVVQ